MRAVSWLGFSTMARPRRIPHFSMIIPPIERMKWSKL